ncbi:MAG: TenA family transcriptional regulator [Acidobacteriota bacterium]
MVTPRRIDFQHQALQSIPLDDTSPPPETSIAWKLWSACDDLAQQALASDYIQGIKTGELDPNRYGHYTLQDAVYCHHAQDDCRTLAARATATGDASIAAFAKARYDSFVSYNRETFEAWHIADPKAVAPGDAAQAYIDFEHRTASESPPIHGLIAMIPCDQLWAWLATSLHDAATPTNLYRRWITDNADWHGAYRLDNFIDGWFAEHPESSDWDQALLVYRSAMTCEVNFFRSACGQALVAMPSR